MHAIEVKKLEKCRSRLNLRHKDKKREKQPYNFKTKKKSINCVVSSKDKVTFIWFDKMKELWWSNVTNLTYSNAKCHKTDFKRSMVANFFLHTNIKGNCHVFQSQRLLHFKCFLVVEEENGCGRRVSQSCEDCSRNNFDKASLSTSWLEAIPPMK